MQPQYIWLVWSVDKMGESRLERAFTSEDKAIYYLSKVAEKESSKVEFGVYDDDTYSTMGRYGRYWCIERMEVDKAVYS